MRIWLVALLLLLVGVASTLAQEAEGEGSPEPTGAAGGEGGPEPTGAAGAADEGAAEETADKDGEDGDEEAGAEGESDAEKDAGGEIKAEAEEGVKGAAPEGGDADKDSANEKDNNGGSTIAASISTLMTLITHFLAL